MKGGAIVHFASGQLGQHMIRKLCFFRPKKMRFMQIESVLQTKNRSERQKIGFL